MAVPQRDSFVPSYRPLMELGRGGMARVYLAESLASGPLHKLVVLKVLNQELASDPEMRSAFIREAEISARLDHPHIGNVYEVFEHGQTPVMVMQYIDGVALSDITSKLQGRIPLKLHLHILCLVLDALHYFHELRAANGESLECVHRDVSPHNVMVLHEGGIKVVDFGVAKVRVEAENHTRTGVIKGKVAYMPPEQLLACANVDRRADIYSVGVMLWEAVASRRMWRGMDPSSRMRAVVRGEVPDIREAAPGVSDALARIIERALSHAPDGRYATAQEMQIELEQIAHTEGGYALPRELGEFMRLHFGDDRRVKQRAIEKALEDPDFSISDASWHANRAPDSVSDRSAVEAAPSVASAPRRRWRKPLVGGVVALLSCLVAVVMTLPEPAPTPAAVTAAPHDEAPVMLRVQSDPAGAEVYLDGVKLGVTPLLQTREPSAAPSTLELRAPGRVVRSEVIRLKDDVALDLALQEEAAGVAPAREDSASPEPAQREDADRRLKPTRHRRSQAASVSSPRPATQVEETAAEASGAEPVPSPSADCDPPYRLDPGGVKVFKPQCF